MATQDFEKATLETLKKILSANQDLKIVYTHHGYEDPTYTHKVSMGDTEIFSVMLYRDSKTDQIIADKCKLVINGKAQNWPVELLEALHDAADSAYWAQENAKDNQEQQAKEDKIKQEQEQMMSFLNGFLPKTK